MLNGLRPSAHNGFARQDTAGSPSRRRPQAWRSLFFAPWTSRQVALRPNHFTLHSAFLVGPIPI